MLSTPAARASPVLSRRPEAEMSHADEEAIRMIIAEMTDASSKHDARAATRRYASDADFVTGRGERFTGAAEIERRLAAIFATRGAEVTVETLSVTVRFIRPDVAIAHVLNELRGLVSPDGHRLPAQQELSLRVFTRDDATWRATAFHNTVVKSR
jgi:uncharacterized protein (TIGR02246 family)